MSALEHGSFFLFLHTETPFGLREIQETISFRGMRGDDSPSCCHLTADFPLFTHNRGSHLDSQALIKEWAITKGLWAVNSICLPDAYCRCQDFDIRKAVDKAKGK